jgi:type IV secretion system protein VirB8
MPRIICRSQSRQVAADTGGAAEMSAAINMQVVPVTDANTEDLYRSVVPIQAQQALMFQKSSKRSRRMSHVALAVCFAEALTITALLPLQKITPIFVYLDRLGTTETATAFSDLPADHRIAGIDALLWQYLAHREHYSPSEADQSYNIVSAMSVETVKQQYQKWANPKLNPDSLATKLGAHGFVRVYRINSSWLSHADDYTTGVYQIHFCRLVVPEGQTATAQRMVATLRYQLVDTIPLWERLTVNHAGMIITEYPGPETEGSDLKLVGSPGVENPCAR